MADISKIKAINGTVYDIKDTTARTGNIDTARLVQTSFANPDNMANPTIMPLINDLRANRLAFLPADQIIIEKSTDGGTTWVDAGISNAVKTGLFSETRAAVQIPLLNGEKNTLCKLRVTFTAMKYNVPEGTAETEKYNYWNAEYVQSTERYNRIENMYFWLSSGPDRITVKVERATGAKPNTWVTAFDDATALMFGRSGNNFIKVPGNAFGGSKTQTGNYWNYRVTFTSAYAAGQSEFNASNITSAQNISEIRAYGKAWWTAGNKYAASDHMYSWDYNKNVTFPAKVTATSFAGSGTDLTALNASNLSSGTVPAARLPVATSSAVGGVKVGTNLSISNGVLSATDTTYSEATTSTAGLMSAADKTKVGEIDDKADKADTVLDTTLSRGRASGSSVGTASFAFGLDVTASGDYSHAEGQGTIAPNQSCHAEGKYNIAPASGVLHIVGNGTSDSNRSNAHTLDDQGNAWYAGDVMVGANNDYLLREKNLADRYSASATYAVGDYCIYNGQLYKCTTAISTAEAWDSTHWTATDILSEGGGGSEISMDVSDDTMILDFDSDFHRVTTTTLRDDYSPNGSSWTDTASSVGFENGGYIEAKIDLSTVTGTRENILSIGGEIDSWTTSSSAVGHYHLYYTSGDDFVNCTVNNTNSAHGPATVTPNSEITIRVDKDGLWVDGVKIVPKYTSRQYTSVYNTYLALNKAVLSYVTSESSISVGSAEGSNRSHATYDYIKVVHEKPSQVSAIKVNDVTLDVSTKAEQIDALTSKINYTRTSLAIHAVGNTHDAIAEGQFVYVRDHSTLSNALYTATTAIPADGTLNSSKLTVTNGALNILLGKLTTKDVSSSITVSSTTGTIGSMTAYRTGNQVSLAFILTLNTAVDNASLGCTALFSDSSLMPTNRQAGGSNDANVVGVNIDPTTGGANLNAMTNTAKASGSAMWLLYSYICTG